MALYPHTRYMTTTKIHTANMAALSTDVACEVQAGLFIVGAITGRITEPVADDTDPNPDFMFREDVDAAIEDHENYLREAAEEDRAIAAWELRMEQEADYRQTCWD